MAGASVKRGSVLNRQHEQALRHSDWVAEQGGMEHPTHISTLLQDTQQVRIAWLKKWAQPPILEVGCNWGYVLACVEGQAGIDISPECIQVARRLAPGREVVIRDALALPYEDGQFDTVMLAEILEHIAFEDVPKAISEAQRVSSRQVLVTVPNGEEDTPEAICFKHQWVCTQAKLVELFPRGSWEMVGLFYCIRLLKRGL